jgi:predicted nuclease of predicted toxin-antitoxin system
MERAEDMQILERARSDERVCVTLEHDFHAHLALTGNGRPSVVLLRVQGLDALGQADLIRSVYAQCEDALREGAAVSADGESIGATASRITISGSWPRHIDGMRVSRQSWPDAASSAVHSEKAVSGQVPATVNRRGGLG